MDPLEPGADIFDHHFLHPPAHDIPIALKRPTSLPPRSFHQAAIVMPGIIVADSETLRT